MGNFVQSNNRNLCKFICFVKDSPNAIAEFRFLCVLNWMYSRHKSEWEFQTVKTQSREIHNIRTHTLAGNVSNESEWSWCRHYVNSWPIEIIFFVPFFVLFSFDRIGCGKMLPIFTADIYLINQWTVDGTTPTATFNCDIVIFYLLVVVLVQLYGNWHRVWNGRNFW